MPNENEQATPQQPLNPDLAGYPTTEALVAGYRNSGAEAKRLREEKERLESLVVQLAGNGSNSRPSIPDRALTPEARLTEFGVPVDSLEQYVNNQINRAFAPLTNGMQARTRLVSDHPEYVQFETDVARFIESDPSLSASYPRMFEADPTAAMEYAFLKFGESRRRETPVAGNGDMGNPVDASIPSSRGGDSRRAPDKTQELAAAFERFQKTGSSVDARAYARMRLKDVISDEFLNQ